MTITRCFGLSINTQTGETERWAAGDPASVADHLPKHRPAGSQCIQCEHSARDCSALDFASMRPAGKRDPDGSQRVACSGYVRRVEDIPCAVCMVGNVTLKRDDAGYYRSCDACGSDYASAKELAMNRGTG